LEAVVTAVSAVEAAGAAPSLRRRTRRSRRAGSLLVIAAAGAAAAGAASRPAIAPSAPPAPLRAALAPAAGPRPELLALAERAADRHLARHAVARPDLLTVIDYSLASTEPRLWVIDRATGRVLFRELVAHGKGSGENHATRFSNREGSLQSSLGLFLTEESYVGRNGYSMRLRGLEPGVNDLARQRTIVVHGAPYVSSEFVRRHGRLGRSWGCPALEAGIAREVIDRIRDGSLLFVYGDDPDWRSRSPYLAADALAAIGPPAGTAATGSAP